MNTKFDFKKIKLLSLGLGLSGFIILVSILLITLFLSISNQFNFESDNFGEDEYIVTKVIDGDTIEATRNGITLKIRYIGVDTPETVKPNTPVQCFGEEASNFNKQLVMGKKVRLESDTGDEDRFNRKLRYVYIAEGNSSGAMVNELLISEGYATLETVPPNTKYVEKFKEEEKKAREAGKGLWSKCR